MSGPLLRRIPRTSGLCAEQIEVRGAPDQKAVLLDQFGLSHGLGSETILGREPGEVGIAVVESSVSRRHAQISYVDGAWLVNDLGSTNGTFLDGHRVREPRAIHSDQLLVIGDVGFLFFDDGSEATAMRATESIRATAASNALQTSVLKLTQPSGGGGGHAEHEGQSVQLGVVQYALLEVLAKRFIAERHEPEDVRGFIRTVELLPDLPWNTPYPTDNHLKQVVRRVRRALEQINLTDAIESRQRFGYRLCVEPEMQQ